MIFRISMMHGPDGSPVGYWVEGLAVNKYTYDAAVEQNAAATRTTPQSDANLSDKVKTRGMAGPDSYHMPYERPECPACRTFIDMPLPAASGLIQIGLTHNEVVQVERCLSRICLNDVEASVLHKLRSILNA